MDNITTQAQRIQRLASLDAPDYDDLKQIYKLATAILIERELELERREMDALCGPDTQDDIVPSAAFEDGLSVPRAA